jgi:hypothetical protein
MNDFDYDCMQKKRTARGAFAHISRKRGGCTLPSDNLTAKQRREKNGEVKSYNITRPMPWPEFKAMREDLKREFFRNMQSFGGTASWLADMKWASAEQQTAAEKPAEEPTAQESGKRLILEHARMEFNYTSFTDLAMFLRVAVPESGKVTVEW